MFEFLRQIVKGGGGGGRPQRDITLRCRYVMESFASEQNLCMPLLHAFIICPLYKGVIVITKRLLTLITPSFGLHPSLYMSVKDMMINNKFMLN